MRIADASDIGELVEALRDRTNAEPPQGFPRDPIAAGKPGIYAWWADTEALDILLAALDGKECLPLIYAGQTGAGPSQATLRSRIVANHLGGNIRASTFRQTLAATLRGPLHLTVIGPNKLDPASEARLSTWIREHLRVATRAYSDRHRLKAVEHAVLTQLEPPLNIDGMALNPLRYRLKALRSELAQGR